jgi:UDP-N-acetylmuramate dehydrogenase
VDNLRNKLKKINIRGELLYNEPMFRHTTFKTGGCADIFISPADTEELTEILRLLRSIDSPDVPVFVFGGGANLLVSDKGIRGVVINISKINEIEVGDDGKMSCGAGASVDDAAEAALGGSYSGFDAFYGMPGTIGGAVWMNARCYGKSISDLLTSVDYIDIGNNLKTIKNIQAEFSYKHSPFQGMYSIIVKADFQLVKGKKQEIRRAMLENRADREKKGHYAAPCAGSIFKNNRAFGKPSGAIIDSLGLRGTAAGGASVSEKHANIIINNGDASSSDIFSLVQLISERVKQEYGYSLEPEIQFIGEF